MSTASSSTDQNDQATTTSVKVPSPSSQDKDDLSAVSSPISILSGQILIEEDHEDILIQQIDELVRGFLRLPNR